MSFSRSGGLTARNFRPCLPQNRLRIRSTLPPLLSRRFHASSLLWGIKSQVLKDVGEGNFYLITTSLFKYSLTITRYHRGPDHSMVRGGRGSY